MGILNRIKGREMRRTDEIRRKQAQRAKQALHRAARRKRERFSSHAFPPVMAREPMIETPSRDRVSVKTVRVRRRYSVKLAAPGAELRLPSLPTVRFNWRILSAALSGVLAWILFQFWSSPVYRVEAVEYAGLQRLSEQELDTFLDVEGVPIFAVDGNDIQKRLRELYAEFASVSVQVSWPNTVLVTVTERLPVMVWMQEERSYFVDAEGVVFPVREGMSVEGLPVVQATVAPPRQISVDVEQYIFGEDFEDVLEELRQQTLPEPNPSGFSLQASLVEAILFLAQNAPDNVVFTYDLEHGLGWIDRRGWRVYFGEARLLDVKMVLYKTILEHLKAQDTRPELISVESVEAPFVQLRS